jgi:hypothetical protein
MSILVVICIVLVVLGIAAYGVRQTTIDEPFKSLIILVLCVIGCLVILQRSGVM